MFSKAYFSLLELEDLEYLYFELRQRTIRPEDITNALNDVIRFMRRQVKYSCITDLQIGCESNQRKVNLLKLDQSLHDIENFPVMMILEKPEFGVVYQNARGERCFLRFGEIEKYSDGTLKMIRLKLNSKLDIDKKEKVKMDQRDRKLIIKVTDTIQDRLDYRSTIRRCEIILVCGKEEDLFDLLLKYKGGEC